MFMFYLILTKQSRFTSNVSFLGIVEPGLIPGFLRFSTTDILDKVIFCLGEEWLFCVLDDV